MKRNEQGIALVITLFLMASLSALAVSLMFLSQTETASSKNYRTMSQARYAGEAGVHKTLNYLMYSYSAPSSPFTGFGYTKSPVTCTSGCTYTTTGACNPSTLKTAVESGCIVLSTCDSSVITCSKTSTATTPSNYPTASVATAFMSAAKGTLAANASGTTTNAALGTVGFTGTAILMSMKAVSSYGGSSGVQQVWQILADGTAGTSSATVEVSSSLERQVADAQTFAVFATGTGCGAINLGGTVQTVSYDSSSGTTTTSNSGGNVGTNGNMTIGGHVDVHGSLSTPRTGIGSCTNGTNVTALTTSGAATVDNNALTQLPQALSFPTPALPSPWPPTGTMNASGTVCAAVLAANSTNVPAVSCSYSSGVVTVDGNGQTVRLGNISGSWNLTGGTYNINAIGAGNTSNITRSTSSTGNDTVVINLGGRTSDSSTTQDMASPFDTNGQAVVNTTMDPSKFQVMYAGTGTINMTGGSNACMMLYAPNAAVVTHGNSDIWGSILSASVTSSGTPRFIYDRHLQSTFKVLGNFVMTSFSWKKY